MSFWDVFKCPGCMEIHPALNGYVKYGLSPIPGSSDVGWFCLVCRREFTNEEVLRLESWK